MYSSAFRFLRSSFDMVVGMPCWTSLLSKDNWSSCCVLCLGDKGSELTSIVLSDSFVLADLRTSVSSVCQSQ